LFGPLIVKAVQPQSTGKVKARPDFAPSSSAVDARVIDRFLNQQQQLLSSIRAASKLDLERLIVTSPVANVVTYNALNAARIIVAHERRHFLQAKRVTQAEGFPGLSRG